MRSRIEVNLFRRQTVEALLKASHTMFLFKAFIYTSELKNLFFKSKFPAKVNPHNLFHFITSTGQSKKYKQISKSVKISKISTSAVSLDEELLVK